ncbi:MAG: hypothetical protein AABW86_02890 [Candidatus Micrarchaeota archaeon]
MKGVDNGDRDPEIQVKKHVRVDAFGISKGAKPFKREKDPHDDLW